MCLRASPCSCCSVVSCWLAWLAAFSSAPCLASHLPKRCRSAVTTSWCRSDSWLAIFCAAISSLTRSSRHDSCLLNSPTYRAHNKFKCTPANGDFSSNFVLAKHALEISLSCAFEKKTEWRGTGTVICLERGVNDLYMVQLMPLPHIISCFSKIQNSSDFLVLAYPGCPGIIAIN